MKQIAFYGKGGIGKSTTMANIAASMADMGQRVMVIGCDPKADAVRTLLGGRHVKTVLSQFRQSSGVDISQVVAKGYRGTLCVESGGPEPGVGCAGRGIITAIELLKKSSVFDEKNIDVVIYDVLGDVVCGGFAMPIRMGLAKEIYAITSGEFMSVYAANNICKGIKKYAHAGGGRFAGIICNSRNVKYETEYLKEFSDRLNAPYIYTIPRSSDVQLAEGHGRTVVEHAPDSEQALHYRRLAAMILENGFTTVPDALSDEELGQIYRKYAVMESPEGACRPV
jgi:nitrogenase iron protein NifH